MPSRDQNRYGFMTNRITPSYIYEIIGIGEVAVAADGSRVASVKSWVDQEAMGTVSQVWVTSLPDGEARSFTQGKNDESPRFSPNGESIAFLRPNQDGRRQIWTISTSGGDASQVTDLPGGATQHMWSPDSSQIVFISDVDPLADESTAESQLLTREVPRIRFRIDGAGWRGDAFKHVFVVDLETGETLQLTEGTGDDSYPVWSPDGNRIAYVSDAHPERDVKNYSSAMVIPSDGGEAESWSEGLLRIDLLSWAPDGSEIVAAGSDDPEMWDFRQSWLYVLRRGEPTRCLTDGSMTPVAPGAELTWTGNGNVLFVGDVHGQSYLFKVSVETGALVTVAGGASQILTASYDADGRRAVAVISTPKSPGDLVLIDLEHGSETKLTDYNREYLDSHPPGRMEKFSTSRRGEEIESRVVFPPDFDQTGHYPLVVDIHGGPHGRFWDAFDPTHQILASAGYVVLAANPRGTSSYGPEFAKAVLRDWGGEDYLDIMAAVKDLSSRPYIDESLIGLHGYSYGGYMSAWIVGHETHFGAAVIGAPCINLLSMYGTSDIGVSFGDINWGGPPHDAVDAMLERSPLTYANRVSTPVLLLHGEDDVRCPIGQSEEYFITLKRLGKEVEFVRFPGSSHLFRRATGHPKMREEYLVRMVNWFDRHLIRKQID